MRPAASIALAMGLSLALGLATSLPGEARDGRKSGRKYSTYERGETRPSRRSTTEAADGTCRRDTGRPATSLNLNSRCDREEFWARFNDYGDSRR